MTRRNPLKNRKGDEGGLNYFKLIVFIALMRKQYTKLSMRPAKILITGSSGTIGSRLCEWLLEKKRAIAGADIKKNKWNKGIDKLTTRIDLRKKADVLTRLSGNIDVIIHLAANARVYNSVVNPSLARDNFEILFNVLEYARKNNIKRFIFASSREVYGNTDKIIHSEDESYAKNCESPYSASKMGGEALVYSYCKCYGIDFIILRFSNVYGMYDDSNRLIPFFINRCINGKDVKVYGKEKLLDFTYIDDAIRGIILPLEKFDIAKNNVFNIASGSGTSILKIVKLIKRLLKSESQIYLEKNRTGEVMKYVANINKAKKKLGYKPQVLLTDGIQRSIEWYKLVNNII